MSLDIGALVMNLDNHKNRHQCLCAAETKSDVDMYLKLYELLLSRKHHCVQRGKSFERK